MDLRFDLRFLEQELKQMTTRIDVGSASAAKIKEPGTYWDTAEKGLHLIVGKSARTYFLQADVQQPDGRRKSVRVKLGRLGSTLPNGETLTPAIARKLAKRARVDLDAQRIAPGRRPTLRAALDAHIQFLEGKKQRRPRYVAWFRDIVERHLAGWLDLPLDWITEAMVQRRHTELPAEIHAGLVALAEDRIAKRLAAAQQDRLRERIEAEAAATRARLDARRATTGRAGADGAMAAFSAVWNRAARPHKLPPCPALVLKEEGELYKVPGRKRPVADLAAWWAVVEKRPSVMRDWLQFALLSGMRRRTVSALRWADIDLKTLTLTVADPKGGPTRAYKLPISRPMLDILERRRAGNHVVADDARMLQWVFPSERSASGHVEEPRVRGAEWRLHDLKSTFINAGRRAGVDRTYVKLLAHHSLGRRADVTEDHYESVGFDDELRPAMERISAYIIRQLTPEPGGDNVVSMARAS
jgi:integrase